MLTPPPPPPQSPSPPPPRQLSDWENDSASCDSQSLSGDDSEGGCDDASCHQKEPSLFLKAQAPDSTPSERHRFLLARDGDEQKALANLLQYTAWRNKFKSLIHEQEQRHYNLQFEDLDMYDWIVASQTALQVNNEEANNDNKEGWLPQVVRSHLLPDGQAARDRDGRRILHMIPAQMDDRVKVYSLAIALYLDRKAPRDGLEKFTILLDLRPGEGWRNTSAVRLVPFIKDIVGFLLIMFPERLHKTILYPLPFCLSWVFSAVKKVIDPVTADKIWVLSGSAGMASPLPLDQLTTHLDRDVALLYETERLASFSA